MKKIFYLSIIILSLTILTTHSQYAYADDLADPPRTNTNTNTSTNSASASLSDPLNLNSAENTPQIIIGKIIKAALGIVGSLALLMFIYGGLLWMTSAGNQEKVDQGRKIIVWATAGLAVIFLSYAIVNFVIKSLVG